MKYQWEEWTLDMDARVLMRDGRPFSVSRRVLQCISHLIAHRERVVEYDELIRKVWGHDNVTNNQLSQVILSARRVFGDDGQAQRLIVTIPGVGYRWAGQVEEAPHKAAAADAPPASQSQAPARQAFADPRPTPVSGIGEVDDDDTESTQAQDGLTEKVAAIEAEVRVPSRRRHIGVAVVFCCALLLLSLALLLPDVSAPPSASASSSPLQTPPPLQTLDSLQAMDNALREGEFDRVLNSLAALPPSQADSPDAVLIAMRLDLYRGRFERARKKLDQQLALARAADDPIWEAKLMVFDCFLQSRSPSTTATRLASAQAAIDLLEPLGEDAEPKTLADALRYRAHALDDLGRYEDGLIDLDRSGRLYERAGDTRGMLTIRSDRASFWLLAGRVEDAQQTLLPLIDDHLQIKNNTTATNLLVPLARAQMELLRTEDALHSSDRAFALIREMPDFDQRQRALMIRAQVMTRLGRLSEARRLLEETAPVRDDDIIGQTIMIMYLLESGDDAAALEASSQFGGMNGRSNHESIMLASRSGTLLPWTIAASRLVDAGRPIPVPSPTLTHALQNPETTAAIIASARWAMINKEDGRAETLLREALDKARKRGLRFHMLLATEPLFDLLLAQGRKAEAQRLIDDVRAFDRERFDAEFHFVQMRWRLAVETGDTIAAKVLFEELTALAGERPVPEFDLHSTARR